MKTETHTRTHTHLHTRTHTHTYMQPHPQTHTHIHTKRATYSLLCKAAAPVALAYVGIGLSCGVLSQDAGLQPWMVLLLSLTYYSGAGQFMLASMLSAGVSSVSMVAGIALVTTRQLLYAFAMIPRLKNFPKRYQLGISATLTDETFGVLLDEQQQALIKSPRLSLALNAMCLFAWTLGAWVGSLLGQFVSFDTSVLAFSMTAIFIYMLVSSLSANPNKAQFMCVGLSALFVVFGILLKLGSSSIVVGVVAAIISTILLEQRIGDCA